MYGKPVATSPRHPEAASPRAHNTSSKRSVNRLPRERSAQTAEAAAVVQWRQSDHALEQAREERGVLVADLVRGEAIAAALQG